MDETMSVFLYKLFNELEHTFQFGFYDFIAGNVFFDVIEEVRDFIVSGIGDVNTTIAFLCLRFRRVITVGAS